jgi:predicted AAA+ superfamily ATPase
MHYHPRNESEYRPHPLTPLVAAAAKAHPLVVLTGALQVGKSTMLTRDSPFAGW